MLILIFVIFFIYLFIKNIYIKSSIDNKYYYVQRNKSNKSVLLLSKLRQDTIFLLNKLNKNDLVYKTNNKQFNNLYKNVNTLKIQEKPILDNNTSYTINKNKIILCLKHNNIYHNYNELLYIYLHELSHVICPEIGHTKIFYDINIFLLKEAIKCKLYTPINYKKNPINYCGILLNEYLLS